MLSVAGENSEAIRCRCCAMMDYSGDSVGSPIKTPVPHKLYPSDSVHTSPEVPSDCHSKGSYETARDKRVAELRQMFKPIQDAAKTL